ncbi:TorD/DmsD family molecular chaperone [Slackia heliotrinireducens]|uniref:TorD/DmsD family molecular chaperone n=1 Tax=Slackia heliotrinireducens TaxID=84110 RepID=UPI003315DF38
MASNMTEERLAARTYVYTVLQNILGNDPTAEQFEALDQEVLSAAYEELGLGDSATLNRLVANAAQDVESAKREYMRVFVGPFKLPTPLWESVHMTGEDALFQEITLQVRKRYRAEGILPAEYPHVPDDHIALELDFLRTLAVRAQEALAAGDEEACRAALVSSHEFLEKHLTRWAHRFAKGLEQSGCSAYYAGVASAAARFADADAAWLSEALA